MNRLNHVPFTAGMADSNCRGLRYYCRRQGRREGLGRVNRLKLSPLTARMAESGAARGSDIIAGDRQEGRRS